MKNGERRPPRGPGRRAKERRRTRRAEIFGTVNQRPSATSATPRQVSAAGTTAEQPSATPEQHDPYPTVPQQPTPFPSGRTIVVEDLTKLANIPQLVPVFHGLLRIADLTRRLSYLPLQVSAKLTDCPTRFIALECEVKLSKNPPPDTLKDLSTMQPPIARGNGEACQSSTTVSTEHESHKRKCVDDYSGVPEGMVFDERKSFQETLMLS